MVNKHLGTTGHVEVYDCKLRAQEGEDLASIYRELVKFFFQFHDPTMGDRQFNDRGTQYASVIYCTDEEQKRIATEVKDELQVDLLRRVITFFLTLLLMVMRINLYCL